MDPTVLNSLIAVGGMVIGFLIRHYLGGATSTATTSTSGNTAAHPLIAAMTAQFDAAIQQLAANLASSTLAIPTTTVNPPGAPPK
jgi:hypothetical protein